MSNTVGACDKVDGISIIMDTKEHMLELCSRDGAKEMQGTNLSYLQSFS